MRKLLIINFVCLLLILSCKDVNKFSAGSYPYAEVFEINSSKEIVIKRIDSLKQLDTTLHVPVFKWAGNDILLNDKIQKNGYFVFYIFIKERNQIIQSYIEEKDSNRTNVGLISVQNGLSLGNWKQVNRDLSEQESQQLKEIFKERVISKIK